MKHKLIFFLSAFFLSSMFITSCVDQEFDEPPVFVKELPEANTTVAELVAMHTLGQKTDIQDEIIIRGIVTADDRSGNFFRGIVMEDETAGIAVRINMLGLYNQMPIGTDVAILCNGLVITDFAGTPQLSGAAEFDDRGFWSAIGIEEPIVSDFIIDGTHDNPVTPTVRAIGDLSFADLNRLITFEEVQFSSGARGDSFGDANDPDGGKNLDMEDCDGNDLVLRSSDFAEFAANIVPDGSGAMTGIYSVFNTTDQIAIREITDVNFGTERCGGGSNPNVPTVNTTIAEFKALHSEGQSLIIEDDLVIGGTVIADDRTGNYFKELVIQDETGGINVRIDDVGLSDDYPEGSVVAIACKGLTLADFEKLIQLGGSGGANRIPENEYKDHVFNTGTTNVITPAVKKINELTTADIATLIRIDDVQFNDASADEPFADADNTFSINHTIEDCDENTIILRTSGFADFARTRTPEGKGSVRAVYSVFGDTDQLFIRDVNDAVMDGTRCDGGGGGGGGDVTIVTSLNESFDAIANNGEVILDGWTNVSIKGERTWQGKIFDDNHYAQSTAFNDSSPEMEAWLVTPLINWDVANTFSFESAQAFWRHDGLSVWISADFDGDVSAATWTEITEATLASNSSTEHAFVFSGELDFSARTGNAAIGFKYVGTSASNTTSYRIDNVKAE